MRWRLCIIYPDFVFEAVLLFGELVTETVHHRWSYRYHSCFGCPQRPPEPNRQLCMLLFLYTWMDTLCMYWSLFFSQILSQVSATSFTVVRRASRQADDMIKTIECLAPVT